MQFSEQWLRAYVNPPIGSDELAARLTMSGLEVEEAAPIAPPESARCCWRDMPSQAISGVASSTASAARSVAREREGSIGRLPCG